MKLLLYCTKSPKQLFYDKVAQKYMYGLNSKNDKFNSVNGKIVAECDYDIEKIQTRITNNESVFRLYTNNLSEDELFRKSCLDTYTMFEYLTRGFKPTKDFGYAIHIKNLNILDEPKEFNNQHYLTLKNDFLTKIEKAPQNMMYAYTTRNDKDVLISIRPEWLCKILNGEKTIEIRKKVLKEMLNDK